MSHISAASIGIFHRIMSYLLKTVKITHRINKKVIYGVASVKTNSKSIKNLVCDIDQVQWKRRLKKLRSLLKLLLQGVNINY